MENENIERLSGAKTVGKNFKKPKSFMKIMLFIIIFSSALAGIMFSPIFKITSINMTELSKYTKDEFLNKLGVKEGENIFAFNRANAEKVVKNDPYIEDIKFNVKLPGTLKIDVKERKVRGYVPFMGSYLYIDEYGRVLDVQTYYKDNLPIVEGLVFDKFCLGELLQVENQKSYDVVVGISQIMTKYELLNMVLKLNVSDPEKIHIYVNNVDIFIGNLDDCDEKIRTMAAIIQKLDKKDFGSLDLSDLSKPIIFKYKT